MQLFGVSTRAAALLLAVLTLGTSVAQRQIPDDNLALPVLISLPNGSASGFFMTSKQSVYFVTARHVLFDERDMNLRTKEHPERFQLASDTAELRSYSSDLKDPSPNLWTIDLKTLFNRGEARYDPLNDVAVVRVSRIISEATNASDSKVTVKQGSVMRSEPLPGVTYAQMTKNGIMGAGPEVIRKRSQVLVGNDAVVFGYPASIGLPDQFDHTRPLLRRGLIAGTNDTNSTLILDCPIYFGNSGGPVLELDHEGFQNRVWLIGVVSQYIPFEESAGSKTVGFNIRVNSGYSVVVPIDPVVDLIHLLGDNTL